MNEQDVIIPSGQQATYDRFHYAPAVRAGEFVLCSGVLGLGRDGSMPADISEQVRGVSALAFPGARIEIKGTARRPSP